MRNAGLIMLLTGLLAFFYCSVRLSELEPMAAEASLGDYLHNDAGRFELGRYAAGGVGMIGLLLALFPKGR